VLVDVWHVLRGPERRAVRLALVIAFIDQAMASTAVVNYAPEARAAPARARPACGRQSLFLLVCLCTAGGGLCAAAMRSVAAPWLNSVLARGADADAGGLAQQRRHAVDVCHRWRQGARPARPDRAGAALRRAPPRRPFPMRARDAARAQIVGVGLTLLLVDSAGRRPLMLCGSAACTGALLLLAAGDWRGSPALMLAAMCLFLLAFSASYAGLFWILCSELFSMQAKASAASAATAMLFAGGARPGTGSCCAQAYRGQAAHLLPLPARPGNPISLPRACDARPQQSLRPSAAARRGAAQARPRTWHSCRSTPRWAPARSWCLARWRRRAASTAGQPCRRQRGAPSPKCRPCLPCTSPRWPQPTSWPAAAAMPSAAAAAGRLHTPPSWPQVRAPLQPPHAVHSVAFAAASVLSAVCLAAGGDAETGRAFGVGAGEGVQREGWLARMRRAITSSRFA